MKSASMCINMLLILNFCDGPLIPKLIIDTQTYMNRIKTEKFKKTYKLRRKQTKRINWSLDWVNNLTDNDGG